MNILITGASGFIGGHLVKDYSNYKDTKIVALGRDFKHNNNPPNVMYVSVDLLDSVQLETALEGIEVDIIIHSAGQAHISNSTSNQKLFIDNNIKVTENVLAISKIKNVKK
ncbi:NAD-dependent epimerase/dehydratase family protein [Paenibacillus sp. JMULE4]|uniref:NAD-dependent epimerase/dehydratase family protein n=1 Tax=Paenibacillus sp. JMULE4 TaxID=2518342 RepID=UPI0015750D9E|nr:NAD-dependent epimerase/dehydratase family protein [Paenibacillus sp. JMULE4]